MTINIEMLQEGNKLYFNAYNGKNAFAFQMGKKEYEEYDTEEKINEKIMALLHNALTEHHLKVFYKGDE